MDTGPLHRQEPVALDFVSQDFSGLPQGEAERQVTGRLRIMADHNSRDPVLFRIPALNAHTEI